MNVTAKNIGIHVILQRNENFFSHKPGFIAFTALRPCGFAVYELFRLNTSGVINAPWFFLSWQ